MLQVRSHRSYSSFRFLDSVMFLIMVLALGAISSNAQDASSGALRGTVFDNAGARITGASIALVNVSTGLQYSAITNAAGEYVIDLLPPGDYSARGSQPHFVMTNLWGSSATSG